MIEDWDGELSITIAEVRESSLETRLLSVRLTSDEAAPCSNSF